MEKELFDEIRAQKCAANPDVKAGKMMSSEAIKYKGKVFAFISPSKKMVFKLGKDHDAEASPIPMQVFNPFKNRPPLNGWFEVDFADKDSWRELTDIALDKMQQA